MAKVYISDIGMTRFGRRTEELHTLMNAAYSSSSESPERGFDAVYVGTMNPDEFTGDSNIATLITDRLGFFRTPSVRIENAPSSGSAALEQAFYSIASGFHSKVLVLAGEKMTASLPQNPPEYCQSSSISTKGPTVQQCRPWPHW